MAVRMTTRERTEEQVRNLLLVYVEETGSLGEARIHIHEDLKTWHIIANSPEFASQGSRRAFLHRPYRSLDEFIRSQCPYTSAFSLERPSYDQGFEQAKRSIHDTIDFPESPEYRRVECMARERDLLR